ncbi:hypothetical protein CANINC_002523 [Pichia inconspicua]|uniref:PIPK domain-containing protein n=1 Tax=Pichia inconspicua TaxID=52247 RepID=A0A4T0X0V9_9ASCO|nr:hypothetical protein CANINC_002523 [[Candida] inconspicua]
MHEEKPNQFGHYESSSQLLLHTLHNNTLSKSSTSNSSDNDGVETNETSIEDSKKGVLSDELTKAKVQNATSSHNVPAIEVIESLVSLKDDIQFAQSSVPIAEDENNFKVSIPVDSTFIEIRDDSSSNCSSNMTTTVDRDSQELSNQFRRMHTYRILSEPRPKVNSKSDTISIVDPLVSHKKADTTLESTSHGSAKIEEIPKSQTYPRLSIENSRSLNQRTKISNTTMNGSMSTTRNSADRRTFHSINTIKIPDDYLKTELAICSGSDNNQHHRLSHISYITHSHHQSLRSSDTELTRRMRIPKATFINNTRLKVRMKADDLYNIPGQNISESHENYTIVYELVTGIRSSVSRCTKAHDQITPEDFKKVSKLIFNRQGTTEAPPTKYEFKFKDYAPEVFRDLRRMFNVNQADYLISLNDEIGVRAVGSSGKSGSSFYYSNDRKFIIKTIHRSEHRHLRRILKDYYEYVKNNPNTLLCQFYGLHRLKMMTRTGIVKVHVLVMNNMLPPTVRMSDCYDLKGSTQGRRTSPQKIAEGSCLKDLNFIEDGMKINLSRLKKEQVLSQLSKDVSLLEKLNIMDYSLLLGIRHLNVSEDDVSSSYQRISMIVHQNVPGAHKNTIFETGGGIRGVDSQGEDMEIVYYIGIIDCLTNYSTLKKLETFFRTLRYRREAISAVPPHEYGSRFLKFISDNISSPGDVVQSKKRGLHVFRAFKNIAIKHHSA